MKTDAIVLNNIGGGFDIFVRRLPNKNETVMIQGMRMSEDLAKGGNVAVALSRLGLHTAIIGKIGTDEAGERDFGWLMDAGVDTSELIRDSTVMTGQGIGLIADNGENIMITGESSSKHLTLEEVSVALDRLCPADYFIGGFEVRAELVMPSMQLAKSKGITTVLNPSPVPDEGLENGLNYIDYFFVNEVEARQLLDLEYGSSVDVRWLCEQLKEKYGTGNVIVTLGGEGVACLYDGNFFQFPSVPVNAVDASGAGDGFLSACVFGLSQGKTLKEACEWANWYAAYSVTKKDCLPGYAAPNVIDQFISDSQY